MAWGKALRHCCVGLSIAPLFALTELAIAIKAAIAIN